MQTKKTSKIFFTLILLIVGIVFILNPTKYINVSFNAILIWAKILLPALLPFFIITKLITELGIINEFTKKLKLFPKIYNTPEISSYVFFMSILTGYPVGSKMVADLYNSNAISKNDAKKLVTFTSNSGPMFILGSVGAGLFCNIKIGIVILASHIIGALLNGILYCRMFNKNKNQLALKMTIHQKNQSKNILSDSIASSIYSILNIGGIIVFCSIVIEVLNQIQIFNILFSFAHIFGIDVNIFSTICSGILEVTTGCISVSSLGLNLTSSTIIVSGLIGFGGISTILQAMSFLQNIVEYKFFIKQKITHGIFSMLVCYPLCLIFF